ncbi:MAG: PKD domain-containing protein [Bacteroidota bacterium]
MKHLFYILVATLFSVSYLTGQEVWMVPNHGQWDNRILYNVDLTHGDFFIEKDGFTANLNNFDRHGHSEEAAHATEITAHAIKMNYFNASWNGQKKESDSSDFYYNYLIGNDASKWKSNIYSYAQVELVNYFDGINLLLEGKNEQLRYTFKIFPNHDPSIIQKKIIGANKLSIDENGDLLISHSFGVIRESKPIAWTEKEGKKTSVDCAFSLENDKLSFELGNYDKTALLVIDPSLTFSTFTGSVSDNWGFTACPDPDGNLFAGGIVMGTSYPLSTGAFDLTWNGGTGTSPIDVGITKFNSTGTALLYSTFIGGSGNETPHSIICAPNGELFIFGVTSSSNFPMTGTPFDASFNGGPNITENGLNFNGSDLYISRINSGGTALLASTFVGGTDNDGLNRNTLKYNYGDQFRGEIILDANSNVYVTSNTYSSNFPVFAGMQGSLSGTQDAVIFKMPPTLSNMLWSTYFGGSGFETGNALQLSSTGNVYFTGGTTSSNLPIVGGSTSFNGGISDGYVCRLNGTNGAIVSGNYIGLNEYDQSYFVQLDLDDNVYVLGQTQTNYPITSGLYGNTNSGQFVQKYSTDLNTLLWQTMIGAGTGNVEISPTAFLVSDCYEIYLSGWGGELNQNSSVSQALFSTTNGFPVTSDAFQANTNGSNFYVAVLTQDAASLEYGTFMGGTNSSSNHVDGGTSRFDKSGRIYHAVCGACGGNNTGFTTTPGVFAPQNPSTNCNLAAFKFELNQIDAVVATPDPLICLPDPVIFNNNSANGNAFFWDFGDNTTSTQVNPTHLYAGPGVYTVTLVVSDTNGCFTPDSTTFIINIGDFQGGITPIPSAVCPGTPTQLDAFGGANYLWSPANALNDATIANPIATVFQTTQFTVIISDSCGVDTLEITLPVFDFQPLLTPDTAICIGNSVQIGVSAGASFAWSPATGLDDPNAQNPTATPMVSTEYAVVATSADGCPFEGTVLVEVFFNPPIPVIPDTVFMCEDASIGINVSGATSYFWSPNQFIDTVSGSSVIVSPPNEMYYYCDFVNVCGSILDSVYVAIIDPQIVAGNDTIICVGENAFLWAEGASNYLWTPSLGIATNPNAASIVVQPTVNTLYYVTGIDAFGCVATDSVLVELYPIPFIQASPDVYAFYGDVIGLSAESSTPGAYIWGPTELVSCVVCPSITTSPNQNTSISVSYTDENGCSASDTVKIYYDPVIYIPNTFTPDGDERNNGFRLEGGNIKAFELLIFNRWGQLLYTITDFEDYWDGTYNGLMCQDGTYTWKLSYFGYESEEEFERTGHVNLIK